MIILNGKLFDPGAPESTLLNRAFRYGDGLFETIRIHSGNPLFVPHHLNRLISGMKAMKFDFIPGFFRETILEEMKRIRELNGIENHGKITIHVFRAGEGGYRPTTRSPHYLIEGYSFKNDYYQSRTTYSLTSYTDFPLSTGLLSGFKTSSALPYVMAAMHAADQGFDDAVLFCDGYVSETSGANVFIVEKQKIFTPPLTSGCVAGIMRQQVIRLAGEVKLPLSEKKLKARDLRQADEIFITNSVRGILPVKQWETTIFDTQAYTITPFLRNCLNQMIKARANE
ncbi:MAG: aminotransferase class IV [Bacteroidia bacterium]